MKVQLMISKLDVESDLIAPPFVPFALMNMIFLKTTWWLAPILKIEAEFEASNVKPCPSIVMSLSMVIPPA